METSRKRKVKNLFSIFVCLLLSTCSDSNIGPSSSGSVQLSSDSPVYQSTNGFANVTFSIFNSTSENIYFLEYKNQRIYAYEARYLTPGNDTEYILGPLLTTKDSLVIFAMDSLEQSNYTVDSIASFTVVKDIVKIRKGKQRIVFFYSSDKRYIDFSPKIGCNIEVL